MTPNEDTHTTDAEGADPDLAGALADLVTVEVRLFAAVDERLRSELDLLLIALLPLRVIAATTDCRVQELATGLGLTVGGASKAVDRLEGKGWAERVAHPSDRRSSILRLTTDGGRMLAAGERVAGEVMAQRLGQGLEPREVAELARLLGRVRASTAGGAVREGDGDAAARGAS